MNFSPLKDAQEVLESSHRPPSDSIFERYPILHRLRQWWKIFPLVRGDSTVKDAIAEVLKEGEEGIASLPPEERTILRNVLGFSEKTVRDIMMPRSQIQAVEYAIELDELKRLICDRSHTRIPVYKDTLDNVKGLIHVKDLFPIICGDAVFDMALLMRDVLFVPPSMRVLDLLVKMRLSRVHMAIVVDEFGGTDGLVTMENLFEEIVGEIHDEHDEGEGQERLIWSNHNTVEVDAKTEVARLERDLDIVLKGDSEEEVYDTLGGLIFFTLGRVPAKGERITYRNDIQFEILDGDPRRIKRVRILYRPQPAAF